jgi:proteasome accessory factor A
LAGVDSEIDWILQAWSETLQLLIQDRHRLIGKLDWVTKQWLLETFVREEQIGWDDPWLASLDLEYHNINPARGLFRGLEADGKVWRMTNEADVEQALAIGPLDTRGGLRGICVRRFSDQITDMQWERIRFSGGWRSKTLDMGDLFDPLEARRCASLFEQAASPGEALAAWNGGKDL